MQASKALAVRVADELDEMAGDMRNVAEATRAEEVCGIEHLKALEVFALELHDVREAVKKVRLLQDLGL